MAPVACRVDAIHCPMISVMALAHRTATTIAAEAGAERVTAAAQT